MYVQASTLLALCLHVPAVIICEIDEISFIWLFAQPDEGKGPDEVS